MLDCRAGLMNDLLLRQGNWMQVPTESVHIRLRQRTQYAVSNFMITRKQVPDLIEATGISRLLGRRSPDRHAA